MIDNVLPLSSPCSSCVTASANQTMSCGVLAFLHVPKTGGSPVGRGLHDLASSQGWELARITLNNTWLNVLDKLRRQPQRHRPRWVIIHHVQGSQGMLDPSIQEQVLQPLGCELQARGCALVRTTVLRNASDRAASAAFYNNIPQEHFKDWVAEHASNGMISFLLHNRLRFRRGNHTWPMTSTDLQIASQGLGRFQIIGRTEQMAAFLERLCMLFGKALDPQLPAPHMNPTPSSQKYQLTSAEVQFAQQQNLFDAKLLKAACAPAWCKATPDASCPQHVSVVSRV